MVLSATGGSPRPAELVEPARRTPVKARTQVLVVGGGTAGVAAAVAAARHGADVTLVERSTYLGGLATGGLITLLLSLDDGCGQQVVGGLCQEVTERLLARGAAVAPPRAEWGRTDDELVRRYDRWGLVWGRGPHAVRYSVAYDAEQLKFELEELCRNAGVRLLYGALGCDVLTDPAGTDRPEGAHRIGAVAFQGKEGRFAVTADVVVDTTGDGDLFTAAGCGHERELVAPWLWFLVGGVDVQVAEAEHRRARHLRTLGADRVLLPWNAAGGLRHIDPTDSADQAFAATECRRLVMAELDRLRREVPGFAGAYLAHVADQLDVTESRRLVGETVLTRHQVDVRCDDVVAVTGNWTKYGVLYHIPYRALLARELANLLVAGRHISVDHRVHHATKEIPACFATGEAAGTAAALAASRACSPKQLDVPTLQRHLVDRGAILFPADPAPVAPRRLTAPRSPDTTPDP